MCLLFPLFWICTLVSKNENKHCKDTRTCSVWDMGCGTVQMLVFSLNMIVFILLISGDAVNKSPNGVNSNTAHLYFPEDHHLSHSCAQTHTYTPFIVSCLCLCLLLQDCKFFYVLFIGICSNRDMLTLNTKSHSSVFQAAAPM